MLHVIFGYVLELRGQVGIFIIILVRFLTLNLLGHHGPTFLDRWPGWPLDPKVNIYPYCLAHGTTGVLINVMDYGLL